MRQIVLYLILSAALLAGTVNVHKPYCVFATNNCTNTKAGGCTKAYLTSVSGDVSKVYGTNGAPLASDTNITQTSATTFTSSAIADDADTAVGLVAYVEWTENSATASGLYELTAFDPETDSITLGTFYGTPDSGKLDLLYLGGAWQSVEYVIETGNFVNAAVYSCFVYTNKTSETPTSYLVITTNNDGNNQYNNHLYIVGFKATVGDLDIGGAYYQSPLDALRSGISANYPQLNGNGGSYIVSLSGNLYNIQFRNIYFTNCTSAAIYDGTNTTTNLGFVNCRSSSVGRFVNCEYEYLTNCYLNYIDTTVPCVASSNVAVTNCIFKPTSNTGTTTTVTATNSIQAVGNIFIDGVRGLQSVSHIQYYLNNVFYGQTEAAIKLHMNGSQITSNNIAYLAATSDNMFGSWLNNGTDYGTILLADNNCIWSAGGKLTNKLESVYGTVNDFDWPATTIEEDPLFANPTGYDFRPQNPKVKSGGIKTLYGETQPIGLPNGETQPIGLPIYPKINSVFGKEKSLYEN